MESILYDYTKITVFYERLKEVSDELFFSPIAENKWSTAAIVSHFIYWDRYILKERLPSMLRGLDLEKGQVSVDEMNARANEYAHSGVSKNDLLEEATSWRMKSAKELEGADFDKTFRIGEKPLTLKQFILGDIEHDQHHIAQIEEYLKNHSKEDV